MNKENKRKKILAYFTYRCDGYFNWNGASCKAFDDNNKKDSIRLVFRLYFLRFSFFVHFENFLRTAKTTKAVTSPTQSF